MISSAIPPQPQNLMTQPLHVILLRVLRGAVQGNFLYVLSAALMLFACYHLMDSPSITGTIFERTLKTLLILQGYEVLVIAAAVFIVHRLRLLDDAYTLLLVEITLLLDPTFFSNAFITMTGAKNPAAGLIDGLAVNACCLALVPVKLWVLQRGTGVRLTSRAWMAFLFTSVIVYLAEAPLSVEPRLRDDHYREYFDLLTWTPWLFAVLAPYLGGFIRRDLERGDVLSVDRRVWLERILLWLPLAIILAHVIESSRVHELPLWTMRLAPFILAAGALLLRSRGRERAARFLPVLDIVHLTAMGIAYTWYSTPAAALGFEARWFTHGEARMLLALGVLVCMGHYAYIWKLSRSRAALYRVYGIAAISVVVILLHLAMVQTALHFIWAGVLWALHACHVMLSSMRHAISWCYAELMSLAGWMLAGFEHLYHRSDATLRPLGGDFVHVCAVAYTFAMTHFAALVFLGLLAGAIMRRRFNISLAAMLVGLWALGDYLPGGRERWGLDLIQAALAGGLILSHLLQGETGERRVARIKGACFMLGITWTAVWGNGAVEDIWILAGESIALLAAGLYLRHVHYATLGATSTLMMLARFAMQAAQGWSAAVQIMAVALVVFGAALVLTFNKGRALRWLELISPAAPPKPPMSPGDAAE